VSAAPPRVRSQAGPAEPTLAAVPDVRGSALVTGASRGLGAVIARRLAADGWPVAVNARRDGETVRAVAASIEEAGGRAEVFAADVTAEADVAALVPAVAERLGPVTVVVCNATGPQPAIPVEELTWRAHLDQLEFFVKSPTLLVQAALPYMRERGGGRIVQIGSDAFERASPRTSAYTAAKGAQLGLTRSWARELGPLGITVNLVAPGWIPVERHVDADPADLERYAAHVPLRRLGVPEDVASVVAFLVSDGAGFVTGERITVNGGHTID
jgi:3-oxoacyl-[acyl-carrier protein] reductase